MRIASDLMDDGRDLALQSWRKFPHLLLRIRRLAHQLQQRLLAAGLGQEIPHPQLHRLVHRALHAKGRDHNDLGGPVAQALQLPQQTEAVQLRQNQIQ